MSSAVLLLHLLAQLDYIRSELDNEDTELPSVTFKDLLTREEKSEDLRQANVSIFQKGRKVDCTVGSFGGCLGIWNGLFKKML